MGRIIKAWTQTDSVIRGRDFRSQRHKRKDLLNEWMDGWVDEISEMRAARRLTPRCLNLDFWTDEYQQVKMEKQKGASLSAGVEEWNMKMYSAEV